MSTPHEPSRPDRDGASRADASVTAGALLQEARRQLRAAPFRPSPREALLLLARCCDATEASILAHPERVLTEAERHRFDTLLERRLRGEPVAYLLGEREFWGRSFEVDSRGLIPRPETEHLVELALGLPLAGDARVLDLGTGSGCLAVTVALERPSWRVVATDRSLAALALARRNVRRHGMEERIVLASADLLDSLRGETFDLVISNPPYVDPADRATLSPEITEFEPEIALFAEEGGLGIYRRLLGRHSPLRAGTRLLLEIGAGQLDAVHRLAKLGGFELAAVVEDLAGRPRTLHFVRI